MCIVSFRLWVNWENCRKMMPQNCYMARISTSKMTAALLHNKISQKLLMEMVHGKVIRMRLHAWNPLVVHLIFHCLKLKMNSTRSGLLQLFRQHLELSWYSFILSCGFRSNACKCRLLKMLLAPISQQTWIGTIVLKTSIFFVFSPLVLPYQLHTVLIPNKSHAVSHMTNW